MVVPVWQICPKCRRHFEGSGAVGDPCPTCMGLDEAGLQEALNQMYYQEEENNDRQITS